MFGRNGSVHCGHPKPVGNLNKFDHVFIVVSLHSPTNFYCFLMKSEFVLDLVLVSLSFGWDNVFSFLITLLYHIVYDNL